MEPFLAIENVNKSYTVGEESLHVLKDITLCVERGEYLTVLGPSGSGKSTLMNILGCMDTLDSEPIFWMARPCTKQGDNELTLLRNRKIGFIFQKYHLVPQYTSLQNVIMPSFCCAATHARRQSRKQRKAFGL